MQSKTRLALMLSATLAATSLFANDKPVAVVNGVAIPHAKLEQIVKAQAERGMPDSPELRTRIKDMLVTQEILVQEAMRQNLDKNPEVAAELDNAKRQIVTNFMLANYAKSVPVSEDQIKKEYETQVVAQTPKGKEFRARHILVKTDAEAKAVLAELKKGKSFEDLAKAKSEDPGSKVNGGDLGWFQPQSMVKEFGDAVQKLAKGQITAAPVKTNFGFHVIKLEDLRDIKAPALNDEMRAQLTQFIQRGSVEKLISDLKAKAKIE